MAMAIMTVAIRAMMSIMEIAMMASQRGKITPIDGQEYTFVMMTITAMAKMSLAMVQMIAMAMIASQNGKIIPIDRKDNSFCFRHGSISQ